jgi:TM2 domain-containing membrane protein YozV
VPGAGGGGKRLASTALVGKNEAREDGAMRGQILGVDRRTGEGQVSGEDGRRYAFHREDWAHDRAPAVGLLVDFAADADRARSIFPVPGGGLPATAAAAPPGTDRNRVVAAVLAFFLGTLGVHRFYLGRVGSGIAMLVLSVTVVGLLLTGPWALIDMIRYLVMSDAEFAARYPRA